MNRVQVNFDQADAYVAQQKARGVDVRWDGYTMVFFKANPNGFGDKNGAYRNNRWGVQVRIDCDAEGIWQVPPKSVTV